MLEPLRLKSVSEMVREANRKREAEKRAKKKAARDQQRFGLTERERDKREKKLVERFLSES